MSIDSLNAYAVGFGAVLVLGLIYATLRRSVPLATAVVFFASPAPYFGVVFARYEASLPPGTNIRLDWPFMWVLLAAGALMSVLLAVYLLVDLCFFAWGRASRADRRAATGNLRSWQNPNDPRGATGNG